jgi:hypothetical protein
MSSNEKEWPSKAAQASRHFEASGISLSRRVMKSLTFESVRSRHMILRPPGS